MGEWPCAAPNVLLSPINLLFHLKNSYNTMFIEPLEDRIAPASVVALTLTGTALKVAFSSPQQLTVIADPLSGFDIIGTNGATFTLNGSPLSGIPSFPAAVSLSGHNIGSMSFVDANLADAGDSITLAAPIHGNVAISLAGSRKYRECGNASHRRRIIRQNARRRYYRKHYGADWAGRVRRR